MIVTIKQGDTYHFLRAYLHMATGKAIRLSGANVRLVVKDDKDVIKISKSANIVDEETGYVEYRWAATDTSTPGTYIGEFEVTLQNGSIVSVPNDGYFTINIVKELG